MTDSPSGAPDVEPRAPGEARALARGALAQQLAQGTGLVVLLAVVTVLARRLSLSELGAYGLIASLAGYLLVLRNSVASSAVRALSAELDQDRRAATFSSVVALYAVVGLVTGVLIALAGAAIATLVLSGDLERAGRAGGVVLGATMAVGLVASAWLDALRASLLFVRAATIEIVSMLIYGAVMVGLAAGGAGIGVLIAVSGAWMLTSGLLAFAICAATGLPYRFRRASVSRERIAGLLPTAGYLLVIELSSLVMYALDRVLLGVFKSPATVGLYEGPVRAHNLFYALQGALAVPVLPSASRYRAAGEQQRLCELVVRGTRYTLALYVPPLVTLMALAGPVLDAWLGAGFDRGATALAILVSYWLLYGALGVTPGLLVGVGRAREVARTIAAVAALNLLLTLVLTPQLGLEGPALGTAIPFALAFPVFLRLSIQATGVRIGELARAAWIPAYGIGAVVAAGLVGLRLVADVDGLVAVGAAAIVAVGGGWIAFYALVLDAGERSFVAGLLRRR